MDYINTPMNEIGRVVTGKTPSTAIPEYYNGDIMFITPTELHTDFMVVKSEKTITQAGFDSIKTNTIRGTSVMVGCIGWDMGNVALCTETCATNQQINSVTDIKSGYNPLYLYYWLKTKKDYLFSIASVTRTPILSKSTFEEILVPMPQKDRQNAVACVLSAIDKKIVLNNSINDNLQQQLKLMYDYWFTQFDFPNKDGSPYRLSGGQMVSANGVSYPIPADWQVETVFKNRLSSIIKPGVTPFTTKTYLATAEVNGTSISTGNTVDFETRESRANMQPTENSVWFAKMKKSIKHLYLNPAMKTLIEESILSTGFCGLQCSEYSFEYMASFIEHSYFETLKDTLAHGATQEAVNNDDLAGIALVIPSDEVLRLYHERTKGIYTQMSKNICENQELIRLRDWLLPMLMNGQATVSD